MDLALVNETPTYYLSIPQSYEEARVRLRNAGAILDEAINSQENQVTTAQMLTAQTMRDLGRGWETIFSWSVEDLNNPNPQEMSFQWQPGGELYLQMPDDLSDQFCIQGIHNLVRASEWQSTMRQSAASESLNNLASRFSVGLEEKLINPQWNVIETNIELAAVRIFGWIFTIEDSELPLFNRLNIDWGEGANDCFKTIYETRLRER